jgi:hypothetical protein
LYNASPARKALEVMVLMAASLLFCGRDSRIELEAG